MRTAGSGTNFAGQWVNCVFTLVIQCVPTAQAIAASNYIGFNRSSDGNGFAGLQTGTGTAAEFSFLSNTTRTNTGVAYEVGKPYNIVITGRRSGNTSVDLRVFINDTKVVDNPSGFANSAFTASDSLAIYANGANCQTYLAAAWAGSVNDAEGRSLSLSPLDVLRSLPRQLFVPVSAGGALAASASGAVVAGGSAAPDAQVALAAIGVTSAGGSAAAAVNIPLSAAGITIAGGAAGAQATITITAAGLAAAAGAVGLSAAVLLAGAGAAQAAGNAALAAQLNVLATGAGEAGGSASLSGGAAGSLNAAGQAQASGAVVINLAIGLQASGAASAAGQAGLQGNPPGALSASGGASAGGSAPLSANVAITAAGFMQAMATGQLLVTLPLAAFDPLRMVATHHRLTGLVHTAQPATRLAISAGRLCKLTHEVLHG